MVFPGHRGIVDDHHLAIDNIRRHHDQRLSEIMTILTDRPATAYHLAGKMQWNLKETTWDDFSAIQKLVATAETIAHLRYLEDSGDIGRKWVNEQVVFYLGDSDAI